MVESSHSHDGVAGNGPSGTPGEAGKHRTRVCIIGGGAAGMACAWSLSRHSEKFDVTVLEALPEVGGVASTCKVKGGEEEGQTEEINDQVQGGAPSYKNNLLFFKEFGFEPHVVEFKIAFGQGKYAWKNYGSDKGELVTRLQKDIARFGKALKWCYRFEPIFVFVPIHKVLKWWGFSEEFQTRMVFPLTALFFGTGNRTPYVSAAVVARVFLDPELRLFEYSPTSLLDEVPKMFAFPKLGEVFSTIASQIDARVMTSAPVDRVQRGVGENSQIRVWSSSFEQGYEDFDDIVFSCGAEVALKSLGDGASMLERKFLKNVSYYNDLIVTHEDEEYMKSHYEFHPREDMYFVRCDEDDPNLIEMSFNLSAYQPHLEGKRTIYQSIFLDDSQKETWTNQSIRKAKVLKERMTRQFAHTWKHFAFWVPFVRFIQGSKRTWYAGSYTLFNTHEIAVMSGLAAADRIGAPYPFKDDHFAYKQYKTYLKLAHGIFASPR